MKGGVDYTVEEIISFTDNDIRKLTELQIGYLIRRYRSINHKNADIAYISQNNLDQTQYNSKFKKIELEFKKREEKKDTEAKAKATRIKKIKEKRKADAEAKKARIAAAKKKREAIPLTKEEISLLEMDEMLERDKSKTFSPLKMIQLQKQEQKKIQLQLKQAEQAKQAAAAAALSAASTLPLSSAPPAPTAAAAPVAKPKPKPKPKPKSKSKPASAPVPAPLTQAEQRQNEIKKRTHATISAVAAPASTLGAAAGAGATPIRQLPAIPGPTPQQIYEILNDDSSSLAQKHSYIYNINNQYFDMKDKNKDTALSIAVKNKNENVVTLILPLVSLDNIEAVSLFSSKAIKILLQNEIKKRTHATISAAAAPSTASAASTLGASAATAQQTLEEQNVIEELKETHNNVLLDPIKKRKAEYLLDKINKQPGDDKNPLQFYLFNLIKDPNEDTYFKLHIHIDIAKVYKKLDEIYDNPTISDPYMKIALQKLIDYTTQNWNSILAVNKKYRSFFTDAIEGPELTEPTSLEQWAISPPHFSLLT